MTNIDPRGKPMSDLRTRILDYLDPLEPTDPWALVDGLVTAMEEQGDSWEETSAELDLLKGEGKVDTQYDPHGAGERVALTDALEHPAFLRSQASYGHLKEAVMDEVHRRGLKCDWKPGRRWALWGEDGEIACYGPMHNIAAFLGIEAL